MSRHGVFTAMVASGLLMLPACASGKPASDVAVRVGSVVHIGRYTQVFASPLPANQAQAAVVEGFREGQVLWTKSENAWRLVPPVRDYVTGQALTHLAAALKGVKAHRVVLAGSDRFFMTRVTSITNSNAVLTTCDDGANFREVNPRTGRADPRIPPVLPGQAYISENWRMVRRGGHWAITSLSLATLPDRGAEHCQPGMAGAGPSRRPNVAVLLTKMNAALRTASSVHITGTILQGGTTLGLDLGMTRSGGILGQIFRNGAKITLLATHGHIYLKLNAAFLRVSHLPASVCNSFCGKYLKYPTALSRKLFTRLNMASLTAKLSSTPARQVKYLGAVTTGGQLAWLLQDSHSNSMYIAAHGKPFLLREVAALPAQGSVNLTQWNAVRIPPPPPANQTVSLSQLRR